MVNPFFRAMQVREPQAEYRFAPPRRWRFDYAWPDRRVALEVEGGVWTGGRHNRATGFLKDMEKYNTAAVLGWRVLRCQPADLRKVWIYDLLKSVLETDGRETKKGAAPAATERRPRNTARKL